jgi:hypothetical protein
MPLRVLLAVNDAALERAVGRCQAARVVGTVRGLEGLRRHVGAGGVEAVVLSPELAAGGGLASLPPGVAILVPAGLHRFRAAQGTGTAARGLAEVWVTGSGARAVARALRRLAFIRSAATGGIR